MAIKSYTSKVIVSGDIVEFYEYDVPILVGYDIKDYHGCGRCFEANEEDKKNNRAKALTRAQRDLRRLVNSNINKYDIESKFVTLTFSAHITTFEVANYEFKKFRQRLEYELGFKLKYVVVPEFTKIGRIHFHLVMFNMPFIRNSKLCEIWSNGFIKINKIDNIANVGAYVCKYITKANTDVRLQGKKSYFSSRGLYKPIEIIDKNRVANLIVALPVCSLTYSNTFENEYNKTIYKQYNMSKLKVEDVK